MPFWLHESRVVHIVREFSLRTQVLVALCSVFIAVAVPIVYKQLICPVHSQPIKKLQKILDRPSTRVMQELAHKEARIPLNLHAIPQTLCFFTKSGFHVRRVERMFRPRSRRVFGYVVCVQGSFETLVAFLTSLKQIPASRLRLQRIDRISDTKLDIEFFMQGTRG